MVVSYGFSISSSQSGLRTNNSPRSTNVIGNTKANETIRLETLRMFAAALKCRLVYALVQDTPPLEMVNRRARRAIEVEAIRGIDRSSALEGQEVPDDDREGRIQELISESLRDRQLCQDL